ncbi:TnsD family Tn7-like transposition protein [Lysinibacillus fusiformis]|uniref:TnsD family Tn7-like transposition protein n=1 Tax=Lysinibacillus fusiformis TaxID=28031 RepID=UPI000E32E4E2|nr:TnsD family Tn7-like transposition protein [Lysinibacillus fusiformis]AXQ50878.1 hypothetical protein DZC31_29710 [Stenotrophomonas rhizophila]KAB0442323.1 hypothetical protein CH314_15055 [Lysinibacillus fusiformis]
MIAYFPKPYNNELYYSILARYYSYSGDILPSYTLKELTGETRNISFEVPIGLDYLVTKVKKFSSIYSKEYFINNHTIFPVVRPFKRAEWTRKFSEEKYNLEAARLKLFGNKENDIESKEHLYYCTECLKEQFKKYGEGYWNRLHQIPGIFVCTKHRVALIKHSINIHNIQDVMFVLPRFEDTKVNPGKYNSDVLESLLNLSEDIEYIFEKNLDTLAENYFYEKYVTLLEIKGIAYPMLKREDRLKSLLLDYYPYRFLEMLNSSFTQSTSWLPKFNSINKTTNLHPIRHLLLMRLLCGSAREFFENDYEYKPFGNGPWICMNPFADHYLEKVVKKVHVSIHRGNRDIQGDMKCSCGFVYRIRVWEKSPLNIEYFSNRIIERGHIWEQKFNDLIEQRLTLNEIAHQTKLSKPTITKILRDRESRKDLKQVERYEKVREKATNYKKIWLELCEKYPEYSRHELNMANRAVYTWLRKHEKEWLEANSPMVKKTFYRKKKVYSVEVDYDLLSKAQNIISTWSELENERNKLIRKSKYKIRILLGLGGDTKITRKRYPLTSNYIDSIEESPDEFKKRKVRNLLEGKFKNEIVSLNKVAEAACVRKYIRDGGEEIKLYIEKMVKEHNLNS